MSDWKQQLQNYLMACGTTGTTFTKIQERFKSIPRSILEEELEFLWHDAKVQRFTLSTKVTIWRALEAMNQ